MNKDEIEGLLANAELKKNKLEQELAGKINQLRNEFNSLHTETSRLISRSKSMGNLKKPSSLDILEMSNLDKRIEAGVERIKELTKFHHEISNEIGKKIKKIDAEHQEYELQLQALEEQEKIAKQTIKEHLPEIQPPPKKEKIIQAPPNAFSLARSQAASTPALTFTPDTPSSTRNFIKTLTASPTWLENFCNENNYTKPDLSNPQQLTFISTTPQIPAITINPNSIKTTTLPPPETAETFYQALVTAYLKCIEGSNIKIHRITCENQETKNQVEQLLATRLRTENPDFASSEITINDKPLTAILTPIKETPHCKI